MKNTTGLKYWIIIGALILIGGVGIGTAVHQNRQLTSSIQEFAKEFNQRDAFTTNLEDMVQRFLDKENVTPLVTFSSSSAYKEEFKCQPGRLLTELLVYRTRFTSPGQYPRYYYICGGDIKGWQKIYKEVFEPTGIYAQPTKETTYTISSQSQCQTLSAEAQKLEASLFYYTYRNISEKIKAVPTPKESDTFHLIKSDTEALELMKKAGDINQGIFTQCGPKMTS